MAFALMHKSKAELVEAFASEDSDIMFKMMANFKESEKFFRAAANLLNIAQMRLIVAGASYTEAA